MFASHPFDLDACLTGCVTAVNDRLSYWIDLQSDLAPTLRDAMRYATFNGGKRLRPILAMAAANAVDGQADQAMDIAAALEMVHSYSLVHDDLPAMDNDVLRRGKPTCHIQYDEATAILAGDALQCLAFEVLATSPIPAMTQAIKLQCIALLAKASGVGGMAGGQALDLAAEGQQLDLPALEQIHRHKTGKLIQASVRMGAMVAGADDSQLAKLEAYALAIGLAFQVQDDILDETGDTQTLGKTQGTDRRLQKATYPHLLGLPAAQELALQLRDQAISAIEHFGHGAAALRELAHYIISRRH